MGKKPTILDIATKLGIAPSSVSKALSNHPRISSETKRAVREMCEALGYKPNYIATGLRKGKSGLVGMLVPGIHYTFFATAIKGAEEILSQNGYSVIIAQSKDSNEMEKKQLEGFLRAQVEGIISSVAMNSKTYQHYRAIAEHTPLVLFDRTYDDENISTVTIDDFGGAVKAVDHLIEMGYKKIAHIAGYNHVLPFKKRIAGYKSALAKHGLPFRKDFIFQCAPNNDEGTQVANMLLDMNDPPDAIFASSDFLAFGAMKAIMERGLKIPDDIGVVGFSNEEFSSRVSPSLTTIDQFAEAMGSTAARSLIVQLSLENRKEFVPQRHILTPRLVVRNSSLRKALVKV